MAPDRADRGLFEIEAQARCAIWGMEAPAPHRSGPPEDLAGLAASCSALDPATHELAAKSRVLAGSHRPEQGFGELPTHDLEGGVALRFHHRGGFERIAEHRSRQLQAAEVAPAGVVKEAQLPRLVPSLVDGADPASIPEPVDGVCDLARPRGDVAVVGVVAD